MAFGITTPKSDPTWLGGQEISKSASEVAQQWRDWDQSFQTKDDGNWLSSLFGGSSEKSGSKYRPPVDRPGIFNTPQEQQDWGDKAGYQSKAFYEGLNEEKFSRVNPDIIGAMRDDYAQSQVNNQRVAEDLENSSRAFYERANELRAQGDRGADFGGQDLAGFMGGIDKSIADRDQAMLGQIDAFGRTKKRDLATLDANEARVTGDYKNTTASMVDLQRTSIDDNEKNALRDLENSLKQLGVAPDSALAGAGRMNIKMSKMKQIGQLVQSAWTKFNDTVLETGKYFAGLRTDLLKTFAGGEASLRGNYIQAGADLTKAGIAAKTQAVATNEAAKSSYYNLEQQYASLGYSIHHEKLGLDMVRGTNFAQYLTAAQTMQDSYEAQDWNRAMQVLNLLVDVAGLGVSVMNANTQADAMRDAAKPTGADYMGAALSPFTLGYVGGGK